MWRTHGARGYSRPLRIIPEVGKVPENGSHPSIKQRCHVLHDDVVGSNLANEAGVLEPKAGTLTVQTCAVSGPADVLAGETAANDINGNSIGGEPVGGESSHIIVARHSRPASGEHAPTERIDLAECYGLERASPIKAEAHASNAGEQVEDPHGATIP